MTQPAWSSLGEARTAYARWPHPVDREWAFGGSTGRGVKVAVVDSGIEADHPLVGGVDGAVVVDESGEALRIVTDTVGDVAGHGTACAGIIRSLAPDCALYGVRVLGEDSTGTGAAFVAGLEWAVEQGFDIVNVSMSTRKSALAAALHSVADDAYFRRTLIVSSAHNAAVESFPWRFASVLSVGCHDGPDPYEVRFNPRPPVEFFARGVDLDIAWLGGESTIATGNSFATAHVAGLCALMRAKHPNLTPFEVRSLLFMTASNVELAA
jgi:subtilisin family serine protease